MGNRRLREFLGRLVTNFPSASYGTTHECRGISNVFLNIFPCEAIRNLSMKQDDRGTGCVGYAWIYLSLFSSEFLMS